MYKHIGIVRLSALGDVIMLVPTIRTIQAQFPEAKITWITTKAPYSLLKGLSGVEFIVIDKPHSFADYWRFKQRLSTYHFDVLLGIQASFRANLLYPLIKAKRKIGFDRGRSKDLHHLFVSETIVPAQEHLLDGFMRFAEILGCQQRVINWDLPINAEDYLWADQMLPNTQFIALNAAASKAERNWFVDRYAELLTILHQRFGVEVVLTGGPMPSEIEIAEQIIKLLTFPVVNLVGKTTTKQLAAVLSKAAVLIAPDTGPAHLAVAMGTKVVGLYAVAPPQLSGPYLSQDLVVNKYPQAVTEILKKDPQKIPWGTRVHTQDAMALITVPDVMEKLESVLA